MEYVFFLKKKLSLPTNNKWKFSGHFFFSSVLFLNYSRIKELRDLLISLTIGKKNRQSLQIIIL